MTGANDTIHVGVIGAGRIGRIHATNAARNVPGCRLVSVADLSLDAARSCAAELGIDRCHDDPRRVIEDEDVDAVLICSSTHTHAPLVEACAEARKQILCEKPLSLDLPTIDRMLARVRDCGVKLMVGFNRRFDPGFRHVQQQVEAGAIGDPHIVRITSRDPAPPSLEYLKDSGGLFVDMTSHDFDMARFLTGSEVESVFAVGACRVDPAIGEAGDIDTAVVTLTFESGAIAVIDNSRKAVYGYDQRVEVFGSGGMVWAENQGPHQTGRADEAGLSGPPPLAFFLERYREAYIAELSAFVQCLREGTAPPVGGEDGRAPLLLAMAAQRSMAEGRAVSPQEVD